jgi:hypothetical protein
VAVGSAPLPARNENEEVRVIEIGPNLTVAIQIVATFGGIAFIVWALFRS